MKLQFSHQLLTSFYLWMDHRVLDDGEGYQNKGTILYRQIDSSKTGYFWASPYKSWVYDSSVSGATIISGVYTSSGNFLTKESGIGFDFINGRVFSNHNWGDMLSGDYSRKEFNIYTANEAEVSFYLENVYKQNPNLAYTETGARPYSFNAPCIILTQATQRNTPYSFGGEDKSTKTIRALIISDDNYQMEAIESLFIDSKYKHFTILQASDIPLDINGDLKTSSFNYENLCVSPDICISEVYSFKLGEASLKNSNYSLSLSEFTLEAIRYPRVT